MEEALLGSVWFRVRELTTTQRITQISDICSQLFVSVSAKKKKTFFPSLWSGVHANC